MFSTPTRHSPWYLSSKFPWNSWYPLNPNYIFSRHWTQITQRIRKRYLESCITCWVARVLSWFSLQRLRLENYRALLSNSSSNYCLSYAIFLMLIMCNHYIRFTGFTRPDKQVQRILKISDKELLLNSIGEELKIFSGAKKKKIVNTETTCTCIWHRSRCILSWITVFTAFSFQVQWVCEADDRGSHKGSPDPSTSLRYLILNAVSYHAALWHWGKTLLLNCIVCF